jgi:serine/threonine protein kinase
VTTEQFGPFIVHECLGLGATTIVHRATVQTSIGPRRDVMLRRLQPACVGEIAATTEFAREAQLAALLVHRNIVETYQVGRIDGVHYVAMELVRGRTLERVANAPAGIRIDLALSLMIELCDAIIYASEVARSCNVGGRFGHLDPSPYNLIVTGDLHLKVLDAAAIRPDAFSVAAIAWSLLAGRRLLDGEDDGRERCDVLDEVVLDALDARPGRRPSLSELRVAFGTIRCARREASLDAVWPKRIDTSLTQPIAPVPRENPTVPAMPAMRRMLARGTTPQPVDGGMLETQRSRFRDNNR